MDELSGKVAVVTGGASGIGLAMTRAFLAEGMKVVVADMDHYQKFLLGHLTRIEGVTSVRSSFVLNQVLSSTELPLNHLRG